MPEKLSMTRRDEIARRIAHGAPVVASAVAAEFEVSEDAIRRDLRALAREGLCRRVYGGAVPLLSGSTSMATRMDDAAGRKHALALAAAKTIEPGEFIFLDNGSTNLALARCLPGDCGLRVATNSVEIASALMQRSDIELMLLGGSVNTHVGGCVDASAVAALSELNIDRCFIGVCAVSAAHSLSVFEHADALFKRALLDVSQKRSALVLNEKFETRAPHRIGRMGEISMLVVEHDLSSELLHELQKARIGLLRADPDQSPTSSAKAPPP
jgi:DeoR/GlpR family transcriptional regulator of sugar metabolism